MGIQSYIRLTAAVLAFTGAGAFAQQPSTAYDPYNPQMQRTLEIHPGPREASLSDLGSGTDQGNIGPFVTMFDRQFANAIAIRAMMEIPLGQAAIDKGSNDAVRQIGRRMVEDYSRWSENVNRSARWLKISLPTDLDAKHREELDRITSLSGQAFDEAFLKEMVHLQNRALTVTHYEASNAGVTGFRTWAGLMLPTIQDELKLAKDQLHSEALISSK